MPIVVNSPFSGKPVKIRDQDIGRAIRDEENRIFYVLERSDGQGYYSAPTRAGGAKDEARYIEMEGKMEQALQSGAKQSTTQVHSAMGKRRARGKLLILLLLIIVAVLVYLFWFGPLNWNKLKLTGPAPPPAQVQTN